MPVRNIKSVAKAQKGVIQKNVIRRPKDAFKKSSYALTVSNSKCQKETVIETGTKYTLPSSFSCQVEKIINNGSATITIYSNAPADMGAPVGVIYSGEHAYFQRGTWMEPDSWAPVSPPIVYEDL